MLGGHFSAPIDTESGPATTQYLVFVIFVSGLFRVAFDVTHTKLAYTLFPGADH